MSLRFTVRADTPDRQRVRATGSVDPRAGTLSTTVTTTGGGPAGTSRRIVIGTDLYSRQPVGGRWAHLDLKRLGTADHLRVDLADPTGLAAFTAAVRTVERTGPHTYRGTFDPAPADAGAFLPIGVPSVRLPAGPADFTAVTDGGGWVGMIRVEPTGRQTLTMTTTFSAHGSRPSITRPANVDEADDFYYD